MSRDVQALNAIAERFSLNGMGFRVKPHSLRLIGEINAYFRNDDNPNGYQYAIDRIFKESDFEIASEFIFLCLDKKPSDINSIDDFKKALLEDNKDPALIFEIITICLSDVETDFTLTESTSKKKVLFGIILILLAMIGMTHTLFWLANCISDIMNSYL